MQIDALNKSDNDDASGRPRRRGFSLRELMVISVAAAVVFSVQRETGLTLPWLALGLLIAGAAPRACQVENASVSGCIGLLVSCLVLCAVHFGAGPLPYLPVTCLCYPSAAYVVAALVAIDRQLDA